MRLIISLSLVLVGSALSTACITAPIRAADLSNTSSAQAPAKSPAASSAHAAQRPFIPSRMAPFTPADAYVSQQRHAPAYFAGSSSRASLSQIPRRRVIQPAPPQSMRGQIKPFETIYHEPTISPYLNLDREEDAAEGAPNYHTFVRPYQQQIETNRLQQRELQRLRGQLQGLSTTIATPQYGEAAPPATGTRSRYMDTAQFYGAWRR